jgi:hypothetical protein
MISVLEEENNLAYFFLIRNHEAIEGNNGITIFKG